MIELIILQVIICYIIDLSGIIQSIEWWLSKMLKGKVVIPKPFSCSRCMMWWIGLFWLLITHQFTLPMILVVSLLSFLSKNTSGFLLWFQDALVKIEDLLYKIIK